MFTNESEYFEAIAQTDYKKPVVHYKPYSRSPNIIVGERANVVVVDHPAAYLNDEPYVSTSRVKAYDKETGKFETQYTLYVPVEV